MDYNSSVFRLELLARANAFDVVIKQHDTMNLNTTITANTPVHEPLDKMAKGSKLYCRTLRSTLQCGSRNSGTLC